MTTDSDRIARLEGAYEHLATKADLQQMRSELERHFFTYSIGIISIATAVILAAIRFWS